MRRFLDGLTALGFLSVLAACGGRGGDRQEDLASLRSLGTSASPLVSQPSVAGQTANTTEVTFYAAVPVGETATLKPFLDSGSAEGAVVLPLSSITVEPGSDTVQTYNNFQLYSAKVKLQIPTADRFHTVPGATFAGGQLRFGLTVATATEKEDYVANLDVFPAGSPELAWKSPQIAITAPAPGATVSTANDVPLTATVSNDLGEGVKVGWFVSASQVNNRRAVETTWKIKNTDKGPQTVAVVVHGLKTRGFAVQVINVTAE